LWQYQWDIHHLDMKQAKQLILIQQADHSQCSSQQQDLSPCHQLGLDRHLAHMMEETIPRQGITAAKKGVVEDSSLELPV
jgi:hypothetical protein